MTEREAIDELNDLAANDPESAHRTADRVVQLFLEKNGYGDLATAWQAADERVGFWYA